MVTSSSRCDAPAVRWRRLPRQQRPWFCRSTFPKTTFPHIWHKPLMALLIRLVVIRTHKRTHTHIHACLEFTVLGRDFSCCLSSFSTNPPQPLFNRRKSCFCALILLLLFMFGWGCGREHYRFVATKTTSWKMLFHSKKACYALLEWIRCRAGEQVIEKKRCSWAADYVFPLHFRLAGLRFSSTDNHAG